MVFKDILIFTSCGHVVQWSRVVCAIVVEGIMRTKVALVAIFWEEQIRLCNFVRGHYGEH